MYTHVSTDYICPLCLAVKGIESTATLMKQADIFFKDDLVLAAVNSKFFIKVPGHVIIIPKQHYENIYKMPEKTLNRISVVSQKMALLLKNVRHCDGITMIQNNEPASGQHAFHYHLHIIPRFNNDGLIESKLKTKVVTPEERIPYANALKKGSTLFTLGRS
ncbi:hypothetical protein A2313_00240 [Candidatus Roizmanbacteria bacterium RIFOXYB2_FULL_41_10]|uniref:HIT domain-containing protein n=1 Tax=Candidatus Roizmanbacteria bacterium RIFOXYA1_FULL_41_12 TaxID=1802082 RepID=A0A1F7KAN8_9BACT|nr:MAG: hypothetical protein A2262_01230 [Candidatus Roizmanbacteria bacterium RIFOXYA2_FULL_41_8]OGK64924.1 MAG: hypothetical protein A2209_04480 [Candidatus Roizmanbacteria bacterium RIFOXYA1_FULL_41_12]OGK66815.1 MAG: hypothetical protein A2377_02845 [Candidatus Roizmanbacteria bacterium RIFOXYB1_FULL_41_27]OGK70811.1 MAG: hypothetical protein A2403_01860 [Candidatus Roizmanbacteria bacterium RIFOXYC1_FULL_41_16]OGK71397.1 MAG: hypothetical protein A2313_00240 [Candidatus Roizmanbacteria bac